MLRVLALKANNFKRLEAVALDFPPGGGTIEICGRNGAGKSSVIDALMAAVMGQAAAPAQPIRKGKASADVTVDLGDYRIAREWSAKGPKLTLVDRAGDKVKSPQALLDGLLSAIAFDPLEFTRQTASSQAATLRKVTGLDFADLDSRRLVLYEQRTDAHRTLLASRTRYANLPEIPAVAAVDVSTLNRELQAALDENASLDESQRGLNRLKDRIQLVDREIQECEARLTRMRAAREDLVEEREQVQGFVDAHGARQDTAAIARAIEQAEATNAQARKCLERGTAATKLETDQKAWDALDAEIARIDAERATMLREANMPVDGLSLEGDVVTFGGVPFEQASTSEQIRASLAIGAMLNPKLRLLAIREGSLLDDDSLRIVADWAEEYEYQVLVERVASGPKGVGVVIEEGAVKEVVTA